jgi:hypothetical protein
MFLFLFAILTIVEIWRHEKEVTASTSGTPCCASPQCKNPGTLSRSEPASFSTLDYSEDQPLHTAPR